MFNEKIIKKMVKFTNYEYNLSFFYKIRQKATEQKKYLFIVNTKKIKLNVKNWPRIKNIYKYCCKLFFYMI